MEHGDEAGSTLEVSSETPQQFNAEESNGYPSIEWLSVGEAMKRKQRKDEDDSPGST